MSTLSRRQFVQGGSALAAMMLAGCGGSSSGSSASGDTQASSDGEYTLVNEGKLTCISNLFFPPFESMNEASGEPEGFDIDISKELAKHMGLEVNWLPSQDFDTLVPTIKQGGKADIAIAGMTITDARKAEVDMSDPYVDSNQSIVVKATSTDTEDTLNSSDKTIAVQGGTTGADWAAENLPNATIKPLSTVIDAMNGVQSGLYDAVVCDLPVSRYQIKKSYSDLQVIEEIPTGEQYGMAISKDNPGLTAAVNAALAEMQEDGTMEAIEMEWFGSAV